MRDSDINPRPRDLAHFVSKYNILEGVCVNNLDNEQVAIFVPAALSLIIKGIFAKNSYNGWMTCEQFTKMCNQCHLASPSNKKVYEYIFSKSSDFNDKLEYEDFYKALHRLAKYKFRKLNISDSEGISATLLYLLHGNISVGKDQQHPMLNSSTQVGYEVKDQSIETEKLEHIDFGVQSTPEVNDFSTNTEKPLSKDEKIQVETQLLEEESTVPKVDLETSAPIEKNSEISTQDMQKAESEATQIQEVLAEPQSSLKAESNCETPGELNALNLDKNQKVIEKQLSEIKKNSLNPKVEKLELENMEDGTEKKEIKSGKISANKPDDKEVSRIEDANKIMESEILEKESSKDTFNKDEEFFRQHTNNLYKIFRENCDPRNFGSDNIVRMSELECAILLAKSKLLKCSSEKDQRGIPPEKSRKIYLKVMQKDCTNKSYQNDLANLIDYQQFKELIFMISEEFLPCLKKEEAIRKVCVDYIFKYCDITLDELVKNVFRKEIAQTCKNLASSSKHKQSGFYSYSYSDSETTQRRYKKSDLLETCSTENFSESFEIDNRELLKETNYLSNDRDVYEIYGKIDFDLKESSSQTPRFDNVF